MADGGSTDGTVEYLKDLKNNKIILINENTGHSTKAYNVGISKTSGDIIGTLGSDDIYNKNIFLKVINYFKDENLLWVVGRNEIIDQNDKIVRRKITNFKNNKLDKYSYHSLTKDNFFPMQSIFWRRSFMPLKTGYFNEFEFLDSSDYEMWLKMARLSKPLIVNEKFTNNITFANTYIKRVYAATENSGNPQQDNYYGSRYALSYTGNYNINLDNSVVFGIEKEEDGIGYNKDLSGQINKSSSM